MGLRGLHMLYAWLHGRQKNGGLGPPHPVCKHNARAWVCKSFICCDACLHRPKKGGGIGGGGGPQFRPLNKTLPSPPQSLSRPCCRVSVRSVAVSFPPGPFLPASWLSPPWTAGLSCRGKTLHMPNENPAPRPWVFFAPVVGSPSHLVAVPFPPFALRSFLRRGFFLAVPGQKGGKKPARAELKPSRFVLNFKGCRVRVPINFIGFNIDSYSF